MKSMFDFGNPFSRNKFGHVSLMWRIFNKASEKWRKRYKDFNRYINWDKISVRNGLVNDIRSEAVVSIDESIGFKRHDIGDIKHGKSAIDEALSIIEKSDVDEHVVGDRRMTTGYIGEETLSISNPIVKLALDRSLVASAADYLGTIPVLGNIDIMVSRKRENKANDGPTESELFHCDWDDTRILRLFIHCNHVTEESGPLNVMPAEISAHLRKKIGYNWGGFLKNTGYRVHDKVAYEYVDKDEVVSMTGPRGTTCFVDTCRCFHYGSRVEDESKMRKMLIIEYVTPFCFKFPPSGHLGYAPYRTLDYPELSMMQKLVIGSK